MAAQRSHVTPEALGRKKRSWDHNNPDLGTGWMDHAIYYRVRRMNVAIVGQPFGGVEDTALRSVPVRVSTGYAGMCRRCLTRASGIQAPASSS